MRHTGDLNTSKDLQRTLEIIKGFDSWFTTMDLIKATGYTSANTKISELRANGCVFQQETATQRGFKGQHHYYKLISSPNGRGEMANPPLTLSSAPSKQMGFLDKVGRSNSYEVKK